MTTHPSRHRRTRPGTPRVLPPAGTALRPRRDTRHAAAEHLPR